MGAPVQLLCNHLLNPLGIDSLKPRLSWQSDSTERNWHQSAYQILVATSEKILQRGRGDVWNSGKVTASQSVGIPYAGKPLQSRSRYFWTVRVWDARGRQSAFAATVWWEMGLLNPTDWQAKWITRVSPEESSDRANMQWLGLPEQGTQNVPAHTSGVFRKTFNLTALPKSAALFVIARGDFVASVNGHEIASKTDWGDFDRKDVTSELVAGDNLIELRLTSHEVSPWAPPAKYHPTVIAALLKLTNADGSFSRFGTDNSWQAHAANNAAWEGATIAGNFATEKSYSRTAPQPAALFRRDFNADKDVESARLYITALGSYRVSLNGQAPDRDLLTPDFTDYRKHLAYQSYDVTRLLKPGANALGITLGDGWYASPLTWTATHLYPPPNRVIAQLEIHYRNGSSMTVGTDPDWQTAASRSCVRKSMPAKILMLATRRTAGICLDLSKRAGPQR